MSGQLVRIREDALDGLDGLDGLDPVNCLKSEC